jgi:hypothetical protein
MKIGEWLAAKRQKKTPRDAFAGALRAMEEVIARASGRQTGNSVPTAALRFYWYRLAECSCVAMNFFLSDFIINTISVLMNSAHTHFKMIFDLNKLNNKILIIF